MKETVTMQQVPFEGCHTYYREAKEDHKAI